MNYTMITNQIHAHMNPPSPWGEPESKKIGFSAVRPFFCKFRHQQNHKYVSKHGTTNVNDSWTYYPILIGHGSFKSVIWHKVEESVPKQSGSIALYKSLVSRDKENRVFYLKLVYKLYNDNKPGPRTHEPPPLTGTRIQKNRFQHSASSFLQVQRSAKP